MAYGKISDKQREILEYIKKENGGVSSARNLGIEISNGKYIMFIDGDDWVDSTELD